MRALTCWLCLLSVATVWAASSAPEAPRVGIRETGDARTRQVEFLVGEDVVARYNIGAEVVKPFLWPLPGPGGVMMTRAWPMDKTNPATTDHVHQKSVWFCHGDVIPEGIALKDRAPGVAGIDFWAEGKGHGKIVCTGVDAKPADKDHASVVTRNEWLSTEGMKVLDEVRTIHLYQLGEARLFVFDIDLHASVCPITFGDTKEGSFGVRINDALREVIVVDRKNQKGPGQLENAEGKIGEKACWGSLSAWCDYSGPIEGKTVGLALFADPSNPSPSCWHARGYGLMAANPFGREKSGFPAMQGKTDLVKIARGEHLKLRFGILVHPGDARAGKVAEYFERFAKLKG